jgi:L-asparaginase II
VQQRVLGVLEQMTGLDDLTAQSRGTDGCGIPTIAVPLGNLALAMARLAEPGDQPEPRQQACARIRRAMAGHPVMVAGSGSTATRILETLNGRALVKSGAEGVYTAALPELGLGLALKIDDGAARAAEVALLRLLARLQLLEGDAETALAGLARPTVWSRTGVAAGAIRPVAECPGID